MVRTLFFLAVLLVPASASAVTVRDIIELTRAGLPDDVLIAVIEADRTIFTLDTDQLLELKKAGVSKAVLLKMIRSRKEFEPPPAEASSTPEPTPGFVVIGAQPAPPPAPVTVVVPQYYFVPYAIWGAPHRVPHAPHAPAAPVIAPEHRGFGRFINDGWVNRPH